MVDVNFYMPLFMLTGHLYFYRTILGIASSIISRYVCKVNIFTLYKMESPDWGDLIGKVFFGDETCLINKEQIGGGSSVLQNIIACFKKQKKISKEYTIIENELNQVDDNLPQTAITLIYDNIQEPADKISLLLTCKYINDMFNREEKASLQIANLSSTFLTSIWTDIVDIFQKHNVYMMFHMINNINKNNWIYICISEGDTRLKSRIQFSNVDDFDTIKTIFPEYKKIGLNMLSVPIDEYPTILTYLYNHHGYSFVHEKPHTGIFQSKAKKIWNYKSTNDAKNKISLLLHQVDNVTTQIEELVKMQQVNTTNLGSRGGRSTIQYKTRLYIVRTGSRGGKYILVKKRKIYVKI